MKELAQAKILITGAGGFIGSHLCEACLEHGAAVRAFVHYNSRGDWGMLEDLDPTKLRDIEIMAGDLRDPAAVRRAVRGCDYVLHLGALIGIPYSLQNPADVVAVNVLGTLHVLQAALEAGVSRMVQTSTSEVYGTARYVPMDETHPLNPQSPYAASKVGSDKLAESFHKTYALPVVILRPFNTYGPRQSPRAVIPTIITQALDSTTIHLGNLAATRDLTFVRDTTAGFIAAATTAGIEGATIQLGTQAEYAIRDLVTMIAAVMKKDLQIVTDAGRMRPENSEVERLFSNNSQAKARMGWQPRTGLREGLEATVQWFARRRNLFNRSYLYHV